MSKTFEDCPRCGEKLKLHKRWYCDCGTYIIGLEHHDQEIKQSMLDEVIDRLELVVDSANHMTTPLGKLIDYIKELKQKYGSEGEGEV